MDEYEKVKLPKLAILGFIGLLCCASVGPISLIFRLGIGGLADGILVGAFGAFFGILIMLSVIEG